MSRRSSSPRRANRGEYAVAACGFADIRFGNRSLGTDFQKLRTEIRQFTGDGLAAFTDPVKLDCDYQLRYEYLIEAVTAVSGYVDEGRIVTLFDKIRLAPPRRPG